MKYEDSWLFTATYSADNLTTPQYSPWFDVGFANSFISNGKFVMASRSGTATCDVDIERMRDPYDSNAEIGSHTQIAADGTTYHEVSGSAVGAGTDVIGHRIRYKITLGGTWTGTVTCAITMKFYAKRH